MPLLTPWLGWEGVWVWVMASPTPSPPFPPGCALEEVGPACADRVAREVGRPASSLRRQMDLARLFLLRREGAVVCFGWASVGTPAPMGEVVGLFVSQAGEAYIWDCYTLRPFRGRGYFRLLLQGMVSRLGTEAVARVWVANREGNLPARRATAGAGFHPMARIRYRALGPLRRWTVEPLPGAPPGSPEEVSARFRPGGRLPL